MRVTLNELIEKLASIKGAKPLTFEAETIPKLVGKPTGIELPVKKRAIINAFVGFEYSNGVLRRLAKEGKSESEFKAGGSWHEPFTHLGSLTSLSCKKGNSKPEYLRIMVLKRFIAQYYDKNGNNVSPEVIKKYLDDRKRYTNQGLKKPLEFLVYKLDNIRWLTVAGETYEVKS